MIKTTLSKNVLEKYINPYFFETGTANGDCVRLALEMNFEKIFSIELDQNLQNENLIKYQNEVKQGNLKLIIGDSFVELNNAINYLDKPTTFWLDAHVDYGPKGIKRCPLYEELESIGKSNIKTHTVLIDDVRMFGTWWGEGIFIDELKARIRNINPNYNFKFEDGFEKNDILVAFI
jgi:hypothetical protein